jgi:hypothetical protein
MALAATLGVIGRPEAVLEGLRLLEDKAVVVERTAVKRIDCVLGDFVVERPLLKESVGPIVEASGSLGRGRLCLTPCGG